MSPTRARSRSLSPSPQKQPPEATREDAPVPPITRRASAFEGGKPVFPTKVAPPEVRACPPTALANNSHAPYKIYPWPSQIIPMAIANPVHGHYKLFPWPLQVL